MGATINPNTTAKVRAADGRSEILRRCSALGRMATAVAREAREEIVRVRATRANWTSENAAAASRLSWNVWTAISLSSVDVPPRVTTMP